MRSGLKPEQNGHQTLVFRPVEAECCSRLKPERHVKHASCNTRET